MPATNTAATLSDAVFLHQFHTCQLDSNQFKHRGHLRLAWLVLQQQPLEQAVVTVCQGIQRYATALGARDKFHHTLTEAIVRLMQARIQTHRADSFTDFLANSTDLVDDALGTLHGYYSPALLNSEAARQRFVAPDLHPLPAAANRLPRVQ